MLTRVGRARRELRQCDAALARILRCPPPCAASFGSALEGGGGGRRRLMLDDRKNILAMHDGLDRACCGWVIWRMDSPKCDTPEFKASDSFLEIDGCPVSGSIRATMNARGITRREFIAASGLTVLSGAVGAAVLASARRTGNVQLVCAKCSSTCRKLVERRLSPSAISFHCPGCGAAWEGVAEVPSAWSSAFALNGRRRADRMRYAAHHATVYFPNPIYVLKSTKPVASMRNFRF